MGFLSGMEQRRIQNAAATSGYGPVNDYWYRPWLYSSNNPSGIAITEQNALTVTDVFKCVRVISETIACLPKKVYRKAMIAGYQGRKEAPDHPLYRILHKRPNPMMPSFRFFERGIAHLLTWGNWYSYIQRAPRSAKIQALWPLPPDRVRIDWIDKQLWYIVRDETGRESRFYPDEILHVPFLGYDGVRGYSPIRLSMDALGWTKATEQYGARFFGHGARPSGMLIKEDGDPLGTDVKKSLVESFEEFHTSPDNFHRILLIEGGLRWEGLTMPNNEAQFIETRQFQRTEICGLYRVPPHKIGDLTRSTNNNIEHQSIEFATDAIHPPCERCEQEFERALLSDAEMDEIFIEFEMKGMMRGDTDARTGHYVDMINSGVYSQNDVLQEENMPPYEGGDEHWIQLNMVPISIAKQLLSQKSEPKPAPDGNQMANELKARVRMSYAIVFRDAAGRVVTRKSQDREKVAASIFRPFLLALFSMFSKGEPPDKANQSFLDDYLGAMAKRSTEWTRENIEVITAAELDRAVQALLERSTHAEAIPA